MKAFKVTIIVMVCLAGLLCGLLSMRRDWIEARPGVRMEPSRPVLDEEDLPPTAVSPCSSRRPTTPT